MGDTESRSTADAADTESSNWAARRARRRSGMAEQTGSGDPRERMTAKRSAGVAALVAAGLAAGALAAGSLASGATADPGDPTTTTSTDPGATTTDTTTIDTTTTTTDTTDTTTTDTTTTTTDTTTTTTTTDPGAPPPDTTTTVVTTPVDPPPVVEPAAASEPAPPPVAEPTPPAEPPAAPVAPESPPVAATPEAPGDTSTGGGREQPPTHAGSGQAATVVPPPAPPPAPALPALSARLLPTPAQIRFYVHATSTPPLPKLRTIDHDLALRVSTIPAESDIHWAVLAALARGESRLGAGKGPIAGKRLPTVPGGEAEQLRALAAFLRENGANRNLSAKVTQDALKEYFGSEKTAKRVGALAAFYGALGLGRMQHGLGWHGGQLRKRVLHDRRLHIYPGGRADIRGRRVDPRVLITIEYLANSTGSV